MEHIFFFKFYTLPMIEERQFKDYNKFWVLLQQTLLLGAEINVTLYLTWPDCYSWKGILLLFFQQIKQK